MKNFLRGIKLTSVLALTLAFVGCDEDDVQLPELTAEFTQTIDQNNGVVEFINTSVNADSYSWDFGDGTTSTLINPTKVYGTGTYTIVLTATNVAGVSDTFEDTISIQIPEEIAFPITFDNPLVDYGATAFNGAAFSVVENPDPSGANTTVSNVGQIDNSGAAFEGFFFELGEPLNLVTDKSVRVLFWSTTPIDVLMKLEQGTAGDVEVAASHGGTGWEELYFSFTTDASFDQLTLFVDGPGTTAGTFYIDEISQLNTADVPCQLVDLEIPIDFDCEGIDYASKIGGDVSFTVVDNPQMSGINSEMTKVGQITNNGGNFDNAFFNLDTPVDFTVNTGVRLKLYSDVALPVLLKFENGTEPDVEELQNHGGTGWEEILFTLSSTGSYESMVLFVAFNQNDAGVFYVDDIEQVAGVAPPPPFDDGLLDNGDFETTFTVNNVTNVTEWIQGVNDTNPAPTVVEDGNRYYSIDITTATPGSPFNINVSQKVPITQDETYELSFEAWTDAATGSRDIIAGIGLSGGNFANTSQPQTITSTPTVYTLTLAATGFGAPDARVLFDLADEVGQVNIDNVSLFIQGTGGGGGGGGTGGCTGTPVAATAFPVTFEGCESFISTFSSTGSGMATSLVANPNSSGINTSDFVLRVDKSAGINRWGGFENAFPNNFDATLTFKFLVYTTQPNVVMRFEVNSDPQPPGSGNPGPQFATITNANTWTEVEINFTGIPPSNTGLNQLVIKPDNPDGTDTELTTADAVYYFDNIRLE